MSIGFLNFLKTDQLFNYDDDEFDSDYDYSDEDYSGDCEDDCPPKERKHNVVEYKSDPNGPFFPYNSKTLPKKS